MDPNIAIPNPIARPVGFPPMGQPPMGQPPMGQPPMGQGFNPQMVPPGAMRPPHIAAAPFYNPIENSQKAS